MKMGSLCDFYLMTLEVDVYFCKIFGNEESHKLSLQTLMTLVWNGPAGGGRATDTGSGAPVYTGADIGRSAVGTAYLSFGDLRGRE